MCSKQKEQATKLKSWAQPAETFVRWDSFRRGDPASEVGKHQGAKSLALT